MKKSVLIGVSGGIAAFKMLQVAEALRNKNINVEVVMTSAACKMIDPKDFEKITKNKVYLNLFEKKINEKKILQTRQIEHIELAKKIDLFIIAPLTANTLARLANGISDDYLTTVALACKCPILIFPSMNTQMWNNPSVRKNIKILKEFDYNVFDPEEGLLACGDVGYGRLPDTQVIIEQTLLFLGKSTQLKAKKVIITSGGTIEPIDSVRFITNKSSGKMGAAIANSFSKKGAEVLYIHSSNAVMPSFSVKAKIFETADDLFKLLLENLKDYECIIHVAAVSDFYVKNFKNGKINSNKEINIKLLPNQKIIEKIKKINPNIFLVGFKALFNKDDKELISISKSLLEKSNADMIIANDVGKADQGFESNNNEVIIVSKNGFIKKLQKKTKAKIAEEVVGEITLHL